MSDEQQSSWFSRMGEVLGISTEQPAAINEQLPVFDGAAGIPEDPSSQPTGPGSILESPADPNVRNFLPVGADSPAPTGDVSEYYRDDHVSTFVPVQEGDKFSDPEVQAAYERGEIHTLVPGSQPSGGAPEGPTPPPVDAQKPQSAEDLAKQLNEMDLGVSVKGEVKNAGTKKAAPPPTIPKILQPMWGLDLEDAKDIYNAGVESSKDADTIEDHPIAHTPIVGYPLALAGKLFGKTFGTFGEMYVQTGEEIAENVTDSEEVENLKRISKDLYNREKEKLRIVAPGGAVVLDKGEEIVSETAKEFGDDISEAATRTVNFLGGLF